MLSTPGRAIRREPGDRLPAVGWRLSADTGLTKGLADPFKHLTRNHETVRKAYIKRVDAPKVFGAIEAEPRPYLDARADALRPDGVAAARCAEICRFVVGRGRADLEPSRRPLKSQE